MKEKNKKAGKLKMKRKKIKKKIEKIKIDKNISINRLISKYPKLLEFFMRKGHFCIGCPYANETLEEFCLNHGISFKKLKKEILDFLEK